MNRQVWKAVAAALLAYVTTSAAFAESRIVSGNAVTTGAAARLNLQVTIPEFIALKVGTGALFGNDTTVDSVSFTLTESNATSDTTINGSAPVAVQLVSNVGNVSFSSSGNPLSNGTVSIPLSRISVSSSNTALPHPTFGAAATTLAPPAGSRVINASSNWTFSYAHQGSTAPVGAGTFATQVTYTAAKP